jgi:hypothetical protein
MVNEKWAMKKTQTIFQRADKRTVSYVYFLIGRNYCNNETNSDELTINKIKSDDGY